MVVCYMSSPCLHCPVHESTIVHKNHKNHNLYLSQHFSMCSLVFKLTNLIGLSLQALSSGQDKGEWIRHFLRRGGQGRQGKGAQRLEEEEDEFAVRSTIYRSVTGPIDLCSWFDPSPILLTSRTPVWSDLRFLVDFKWRTLFELSFLYL